MGTVASARGVGLESVDILILAGGLGTRIRSVSGDLPKILVSISGRPFLEYLFDWLRRFAVRRVVLSLGYRADAVINYLHDHPVADLDISAVIEPEPKGTAGAVRFALSKLRSDPVLVLNGDSLVNADLHAFLKYHLRTQALGSIICTEVEDASRYGRVELDQNGHVTEFLEKDMDFCGNALINAGVYLLSATLLDDIVASNATSIERDIFSHLPAGSIGAFAGRFAFIDIGTPDSFAKASQVFQDMLR